MGASLRPSDIEGRYRARLRELWGDEDGEGEPERALSEDPCPQQEAARIGAAIPRLRRLSSGRRLGERRSTPDRRDNEYMAEAEAEAPIDQERARSVVLRFKAEERLRLIEQRTEETARQRGLQRGLAEGSAQVAAVLDQAEEMLVELSEARSELRNRARREAVELAVLMTRQLLQLDLAAMPRGLAAGFEAWIEKEAARLGDAVVLRAPPALQELLLAMPAVQEGRVRLEVDPHAPAQRMRILGSDGAAEFDPRAGLDAMEAAMRTALADCPEDEA